MKMKSSLANYGTESTSSPSCEVRVCCSCLETDVKLYNLCEKQLSQVLVELAEIPSLLESLPLSVCGICLHYLEKFKQFKTKCHKALNHLQKLRSSKQLTNKNIKVINRSDLWSGLLTTPTEVRSYKPPKRELHTSIFHIDLPYSVEKQSGQNNADDLDNYVDCLEQQDLEIKIDNFTNNYNVKLLVCNHEDLINDCDNNDNDYSNNDDATSIDNEIKEELTEDIDQIKSKTVTKKRKAQKTNLITKTKKSKLLEEIKIKEVGKRKNKIKNTKQTRVKSKKKVTQSEHTANDEVNKEIDQDNLKNALLFYNSHPTKKISKIDMNKRMEMLNKFSSTYNVEVRFLSREEQITELLQRRRYYKDLPFICELCHRGYSIEDAYQAHMAVHAPSSGDYECDVCKIRSRTFRDREKHVNATHLKRFRCKQCGAVTKSQSYAKAHFARHAGASYACEECGKRYTQQTNYLAHMRSAHGDRARACPLCYDAFLGPLGLKVHMGIVHKQAVACTTCGAQFDCDRALTKHLEYAVGNVCEEGVRPCPQCGDNFCSDKSLKKHYDDTHRTEFKCEQCGKSFSSKFKLSTHMHSHRKMAEQTIAGGLICESCGKGNFKNLNQLRSHQRVHTGERPYKCALCANTFRLNTLLKSHMRVHTDERRYKCALCPKAFHQSAHRTAHQLTHTKERPYACSACPKRYTSASAAREHADTVHRGLPARRRDKHKQ